MKSFLERLDYLRRLFVMSFLSLVVGFVPFYANAVLPLVAIAASQGGRLLVQTAGGMVVRKLTKSGIIKAAKSNIARCVKNPAACIGVGGLISAGLTAADLEVNVNNNENNLYDIDVYVKSDKISNACYDVRYGGQNGRVTLDNLYDSASALATAIENGSNYAPNYKVTVNQASLDTALTALKSYANSSDSSNYVAGRVITHHVINYDWVRTGTSFFGTGNMYVNAIKKDCGGSGGNSDGVDNNYVVNKEYVDNTIYNYVTNHPQVADIIKDIHNNYGGDYTVNNENIAGDTINNYYDNSVKYEVTNGLADDIAGGKVDLDKVNEANCHSNSSGQFDWCTGSDGEKPVDKEPTDPTDPTDPDPASCDNNSFNRKVCDFMNWVQNDGGVSDRPAEPVEIVDKTSDITDLINKQMVVFPRVCPSALSIPISVMGATNNIEIDVTPICDVFEMVRPFVIGVSTITMVYIIMGVRRNG